MPRKAKEKIDENEIINEKKSVEKKSGVKSRKSALTKIIENSVNEIDSEKKVSSKKGSVKSSKSASSSKKVAKSAKSPAKKTESKKSKAQKSTIAKSSSKKNSTAKSEEKKSVIKSNVQIIEYYDLPYKYGNTLVRLLAQTPKTLFVYWEVSDLDIEAFKNSYGDDFFQKTKPALIVHNLTLNKTTEIEINDFANCWYLNTEDADCKYDIELVRKFIDKHNQPNFNNDGSDYLSIAQSNELQSPNNHILFEKIKEFVVFKDVSNGKVIKKNIKSFKFLKDIYKFYKDMYDEDVLNTPSSQFKI